MHLGRGGGGVRICSIAWNIGGSCEWYRRTGGTVTRAIRGVRRRRHAFLAFNKNIANVVCRDMDCIGDTRNAKDTLLGS